jgi:hypothetical protein
MNLSSKCILLCLFLILRSDVHAADAKYIEVKKTQSCKGLTATYSFVYPNLSLFFGKSGTVLQKFMTPVSSDEKGFFSFFKETYASTEITENIKEQYLSSPWYIDDKIEVVPSAMTDCATVHYTSLCFAGGAHEQYYESFKNYDLKTGKALTIADILKPGYNKKLSEITEKYFRIEKDLKPGDDYLSAGYFRWPAIKEHAPGTFQMPGQIGFSADGIEIFYNTYEIADYVSGMTTFTIPWPEFTDMLRSEYLKRIYFFMESGR